MTKESLRWCFALLICLIAFAALGYGMNPQSLLQATFPQEAPVAGEPPAADSGQQQHPRPVRQHRDRSRYLWRALSGV
jgi:hypothetical protein